MPSLKTLCEFLERRYQALEVLTPAKRRENKWMDDTKHPIRNFLVTSKEMQCVLCNNDHALYVCPKFMALTPKERYEKVKLAKLCVNCLRHEKQSLCLSKRLCKHCNKKHNTLLHIEKFERRSNHVDRLKQVEHATGKQSQVHHVNNNRSTLLATAMLIARNQNGETKQIRALIDPGSQATLITEEVAQSLRLAKEKVYVSVSGLGAVDAGTVHSKVSFVILSRTTPDFKTEVEALVLPKLTKLLPAERTATVNMKEFKDLTLADPGYNAPGAIDMILGADIYGEVILNGVRKGKKGSPIAQSTQLGWVITDRTSLHKTYAVKITGMVVQASIENQLEKFWEIEDHEDRKYLTQQDRECEQIYNDTHYRDETGKYVVQIPFKKELMTFQKLGDSKNRAIARLRQLEHKFRADVQLKIEYTNFMKEFLNLGHMVEIAPTNHNNDNYYMPHHAVLKPDSTTTKLRVVFDASAKTTSGVSLNQLMLVGPKLQEDLRTILLRWRRHKHVFTADIEKMYRQIKIHNDHQDYQRIVWRNSEKEPIKEYRLTTVTYGTAAAPYLAVKTLQQLATDEEKKYPVASDIVRHDFYVDDVLSGRDTLSECKEAQLQLIRMLEGAGFHLRKWAANDGRLLKTIPLELQTQNKIKILEEETIKTLGIHWNPVSDTFQFKVHIDKPTRKEEVLTKRKTLSEIAKLYDPLGWLAPVTVSAKILMQDIWKSDVKWDEPLSAELRYRWKKIKDNLVTLEDIRIPRWLKVRKTQKLELHGFCDSSEAAYGAVVYSRVPLEDGSYQITLLTAKTKVAPIRKKLTLPKLELCGAHLLSKTLAEIVKLFGPQAGDVFAWSDSKIVLAWIKRCPSTWKTFVANRVSDIQEVTKHTSWRHISSSDNPADAASRGCSPE